MHTKYLLFQKNSFSFFTKKNVTHFLFSDFIEKEKKSFSTLHNYENQLPFIIDKFIAQSDLQETDNIILLFDYPWVKINSLTMPWFGKRKLKKTIPFEVIKKSWVDNAVLQQDFYSFAEKKKTKRVISYDIEKKFINIISALFQKRKLNLYSIEPYIHWLEQNIYNDFIAKNKQKEPSLVLHSNSNYAICFFYDAFGLRNIYTLPIIKQKIDEDFWITFRSLLQRIELLQNITTKIFIKNNKKYIPLDLNHCPFFSVENKINYAILAEQNNVLQVQKQRLEFYKEQFHWSFEQFVANKNFFKKKTKKLESFVKYSYFYRNFSSIRFFIFIIGIFFSLNVIFALNYKEKKVQYQNLSQDYQSYLKGYLLKDEFKQKGELQQDLIAQSLQKKTIELKKIQKEQQKFFSKSYGVSHIFLQIAKLKKSAFNLKISEINIILPKIKIVFEGEKKDFEKAKLIFGKEFSILFTTDVTKNIFIMQLAQKP